MIDVPRVDDPLPVLSVAMSDEEREDFAEFRAQRLQDEIEMFKEWLS